MRSYRQLTTKERQPRHFMTNGQEAVFIHLLILTFFFLTKFTSVIFMALKVASFPVGPFELTAPCRLKTSHSSHPQNARVTSISRFILFLFFFFLSSLGHMQVSET